MKISYKVLKKYIPNIKSVEEIAKDLIMHTAEVEDILFEWENLEKVYIGEIKSVEKHPDSDKLNCTIVEVNGNNFSIVCWAPNIIEWMKVPVAICWAQLNNDFVIKKTIIRWETSEWMICSEDELWLIKERQKGILELPKDAPLNVSMRDYLKKNDAILEIDNKAINHRPDLFSHIWVIRELYAINWEKFEFDYENKDFSSLPDLWIINKIPEVVSRYIWLKVSNVKNIESPEYIKEVLSSAEVNSKWLLIDISNYSLYLYGQPTHCFDTDKIVWKITIRYANAGEKFIALNDSEYELTNEDIVIADDKKILALGWIIWWKESAVSESTKSIIIEWAHFEQSTIRKTWKRLGIRTDSLNVFEKDIVPEMAICWVSLIVKELEENLVWIKFEAYSDIYNNKEENKKVEFDLKFINDLIWKNYKENYAIEILKNLWIEKTGLDELSWKDKKVSPGRNLLNIPFWRKDLKYKADIAEEIARIDWYNNVESTIPRINLWAVKQTNIYKIKNDTRNYFTNNWYFDMYTYSFVNEELMKKLNQKTSGLVPVKNALSEELTHMRWSLIPNLMLSLENNIREFENLKLFELEKIFNLNWNNIEENYSLAWVELSEKEISYYDIQNTILNFFKTIWIDNYTFDYLDSIPSYAHPWRTAKIIVRWIQVWILWEIHPKVANNFWIEWRVWFFEININTIEDKLYTKTKAKDISTFQENNFDLNFVINKKTKWKNIKQAIEKTSPELITKVELIDIYENEEKLAWLRSLTFKIYIQSKEKTLDDNDKSKLIEEIIKKVEKLGWKLR